MKKAAEMTLIRTMINKDFANDKITETIVGIDSSAAKAISGRIGLGKLKHLDTRYLCLQALVRRRRIRLMKLDGKENWRSIDKALGEGGHGVFDEQGRILPPRRQEPTGTYVGRRSGQSEVDDDHGRQHFA